MNDSLHDPRFEINCQHHHIQILSKITRPVCPDLVQRTHNSGAIEAD